MKACLLLALALTTAPAAAWEKSEKDEDAYRSHVDTCLAIQAVLKPRSEILLLRTDAVQLDQPGHPLKAEWNINVCPNCSAEIKSHLIYSGAQPGIEAAYVNASGVKFIEYRTYLGDPEREEFVKFLKDTGCAAEATTDAPGYKIEFNGKSDPECIREAAALYLLKNYDLGKASLALLSEHRDEPPTDFYKACHKEIAQTSLSKFWNETVYSIQHLGESDSSPGMTREMRSNGTTAKAISLPDGITPEAPQGATGSATHH
jgi:hypothetical protein